MAPKAKLPAPLNVSCDVVGMTVHVTWEPVEGASGYQVEYIWIEKLGDVVKQSAFVDTLESSLDFVDFALLAVHVRAIPPVRTAGRPMQSGSPKGLWSIPCEVTLP